MAEERVEAMAERGEDKYIATMKEEASI